ncbi:MAG TPA: FadR/GntR family transcriptional regulator [Caulobacteraceae bacterium]|nr:FadR/GntR family transcriptional regulator [Caulobacteraceae bacterium]
MNLIPRLPGDRGGGRIQKQTVKDQISDKLAYMIHSGLLQAGDELPSERDLAATLGVSRVTVRAAIRVLQERRMIEIHQGSRTRVLGPGPAPFYETVGALGRLRDRSFGEVAEARELVETQVIALAAQRIGGAELARLESLLGDQEGMLEDPIGFQISDREFHDTLYGACRNKLLVDVAADFYDYALEFRRAALQRPGAIAQSVAEHREILAALSAHNPESAKAAMQQHLEQVRKTTLVEMADMPRTAEGTP